MRLEAVDEILGSSDWNMLPTLGLSLTKQVGLYYVLRVYSTVCTDLIHAAASTVNDTSTAHMSSHV